MGRVVDETRPQDGRDMAGSEPLEATGSGTGGPAARSSLSERVAATKLFLQAVLFLAVAFVIWMNWGAITKRLAGNVAEVEAFGVAVRFVDSQIEAAAARPIPDSLRIPGAATAGSVQTRFRLVSEALGGTRILWMDEGHPRSNRRERAALESMGMSVETVSSLDDAIWMFRNDCYDVVVTEMVQSGTPVGQELADSIASIRASTALVFYVFRVDRSRGAPRNSTGITNSPTELLHYVMDGAERRLSNGCAATANQSG